MRLLCDGQVRQLLDKVAVMQAVADAMIDLSAVVACPKVREAPNLLFRLVFLDDDLQLPREASS